MTSLQVWIDHARDTEQGGHAYDLHHAEPVTQAKYICEDCEHETIERYRIVVRHRQAHCKIHACQIDGCSTLLESNIEYGKHLLEHREVAQLSAAEEDSRDRNKALAWDRIIAMTSAQFQPAGKERINVYYDAEEPGPDSLEEFHADLDD
ncbi:hypothetical protein QFC21_007163 [Naganishia friedmannii]|uniref:Uncharacterized protein n=1 Tax=Naganishia friedmannii TaxID=89922 RepID=A0ACC2UXQ0_9TREE|nr:hypothetical protein QFC21_007163 [Naganishia friedmannii]